MNRIIRLQLIFLLVGELFLFFSRPASAKGEFESTYHVRYEVLPTGRVKVSEKISLKNRFSNLYATQYSLILQNTNVENIQAKDSAGLLKTEVKKADGDTSITLFFNDQIIGAGKTLNFDFNYEATDLTQKNGQIWEINIPKLSDKSEIDNFYLVLAVPTSFGNAAFIKPSAIEQLNEENFNVYRFTKDQMLAVGVNAIFGDFQVFDFSLIYHLENPSHLAAETEIAVPPDTSFQRVLYQEIIPLPTNIRVDPDGNWLALYSLKPKEKLNIKADGQVRIFSQPQEKYLSFSEDVLEKNLLPQKYWEVDNPLVREKARGLKTPRDIYDYVIKTLDYDINKVEEKPTRSGAAAALANPDQSICMEYTDLFVALSRAARVPAREINGYAYTTNTKLKPLGIVSDILHSWPEYWDKKRKLWLPVDPTWGETTNGVDYFTKTDLNHFAFVIHGHDSQNPAPAGSYKTEESYNKDLQITFAKSNLEDRPSLDIVFNFPQKPFFRLRKNNEGIIQIKNIGNSALYNLRAALSVNGLSLIDPKNKQFTLSVLPPFSQDNLEIKYKQSTFFDKGQKTILVSANNQTFSYLLKTSFLENLISILLVNQALLILFIIFLIFLVFLLIFLTKKKFFVKKNEDGKR